MAFTEQIKTQANKIVIKIRTLPATVKTMPQDSLIAYGIVLLGCLFILLAVILW